MYVAADGGQYGCHLKNVASYDIYKYLINSLTPKTLILYDLDTKIITVAILEVKINVRMCLETIWPPSWKRTKSHNKKMLYLTP